MNVGGEKKSATMSERRVAKREVRLTTGRDAGFHFGFHPVLLKALEIEAHYQKIDQQHFCHTLETRHFHSNRVENLQTPWRFPPPALFEGT